MAPDLGIGRQPFPFTLGGDTWWAVPAHSPEGRRLAEIVTADSVGP
jgi:hypothetical protein